MSTLILIERLRDAGSVGADLSPGDPVCAAAAVEMRRLWDLADKRWNTIQGLEGEVEHLEGLLRQWSGNCTGRHGSQNRCGLLPKDFEIDGEVGA